MIAFKDELPLVQFSTGRLVAFQRDWLVENLTRAAEKAGYPKWWLAEHVSESVTSYLEFHFEDGILGVSRLSKAVQSVLQVIGYAEVADHFEPMPPPLEFSLDQLARQAGAGYELVFFGLLRERITQLREEAQVSQFRFYGLRNCVKLLQGAKVWRNDCVLLGGEIVDYLREIISSEAVPEGREISFTVT